MILTAAQAQDRIAELEEHIRQLKQQIGDSAIPRFNNLNLYGHQLRVFGILMTRGFASQDTLLDAMYNDDPDGGPEWVQRILYITVCNLRKKMNKLGVTIKTVRGIGYEIGERDRERLRALTENRSNE